MAGHGSVRLTFGGFPLGTVTGTWYFFLVPPQPEVPSEPYRYQNVTCKPCWSLIGRRKSSTDPLDLNQHSQRRIERNCFEWGQLTFNNQKHFCFVVCWESTGCPLVDRSSESVMEQRGHKTFFRSHGRRGGATIMRWITLPALKRY